jgi:zinc-finger of transposase IS204/IS1001/IS1096/IS1165
MRYTISLGRTGSSTSRIKGIEMPKGDSNGVCQEVWLFVLCQALWVFRGFGESVCLIGNILTCNDRVLMKTNVVATRMRSLVLIELSFLLSLPEGLHVERIEPQGALLTIAVVSVCPSSCCPLCAQASSQIHSRYRRTLRDVPCGSREARLSSLGPQVLLP